MEELDSSGSPEGKWEETTDVTFGPNKQRTEKVVYAPVISLQHISLDPQDEQDLRSIQPFVLTSKTSPSTMSNILASRTWTRFPAISFP